MDTIFEKILAKKMPAEVVFESPQVLGFKDIAPQAPIHIIFIHKKRKTKNVLEMDSSEVSDLFSAIKSYVSNQNLEDQGFRIVTNTGRDGGQTVFYTHFHLLAGSALKGFGI
jgi:histidine triad (HIT) family protein